MAIAINNKSISSTELKNLIGAGKILDTIEILKEVLKFKNKFFNQLVMIEFQYNNLSLEERMTLITSTSKKIKSNGVILNLLNFIDEIEFENIDNNKDKLVENSTLSDDRIEVQFTFSTKTNNKSKVESIINNLMEFSEDYSMRVNKLSNGSLILDLNISKEGYQKLINAVADGSFEKAIDCSVFNIQALQPLVLESNIGYELAMIKNELSNIRRQSEMNTKENRELRELILGIDNKIASRVTIRPIPRGVVPWHGEVRIIDKSQDIDLVKGGRKGKGFSGLGGHIPQ